VPPQRYSLWQLTSGLSADYARSHLLAAGEDWREDEPGRFVHHGDNPGEVDLTDPSRPRYDGLLRVLGVAAQILGLVEAVPRFREDGVAYLDPQGWRSRDDKRRHWTKEIAGDRRATVDLTTPFVPAGGGPAGGYWGTGDLYLCLEATLLVVRGIEFPPPPRAKPQDMPEPKEADAEPVIPGH
jgi:hypothetical protein